MYSVYDAVLFVVSYWVCHVVITAAAHTGLTISVITCYYVLLRVITWYYVVLRGIMCTITTKYHCYYVAVAGEVVVVAVVVVILITIVWSPGQYRPQKGN